MKFTPKFLRPFQVRVQRLVKFLVYHHLQKLFWIPCDKFYPPIGKTWVKYQDGHVCKQFFWDGAWATPRGAKVTHWKKLNSGLSGK